jgi:Na+-translocating ferredoxin:NAD+ oxidoreductase subunit C
MLEKGEEMMIGVTILMKALKVEKAYIGVENNKPDAIENLKRIANDYKGIEVHALKVKYPQGGEKQLIKAMIGREVPSGKLPIEVGCVVQNVGTAYAVYEAVQKNKPLFERVVTLTGKSVKKPANYLVRIGTPVNDLVEASGGLPEDTGKIVSGGPMMGKALTSLRSACCKRHQRHPDYYRKGSTQAKNADLYPLQPLHRGVPDGIRAGAARTAKRIRTLGRC